MHSFDFIISLFAEVMHPHSSTLVFTTQIYHELVGSTANNPATASSLDSDS
jgi:hypothetical protein